MLDQWIQTLKGGDCLAERDLKKLCLLVSSPQAAEGRELVAADSARLDSMWILYAYVLFSLLSPFSE